MTILAFMQNQWLRNAAFHQRRLDALREADIVKWRWVWRKTVHYALFAGCRSGAVLKSHLGELYHEIIWEESTRVIGVKPSDCPPPDIEHIRWTLEDVQPDIVITFGAMARRGFEEARDRYVCGLPMIFIPAPHPAARSPRDHEKLGQACRELKRILENNPKP